jgi:hypothetical protein
MTTEVAWSASTPPSVGDGRLECRHRRADGQYFFNLALQFGRTTDPGAGAWTFSLPGAIGGLPDGSLGDVAGSWIAPATAKQASTGKSWSGTAEIVVADNHRGEILAITFGPDINEADATTPFRWSENDLLIVTGWTEAYGN